MLSANIEILIIYASCGLAMLWALYNALFILRIQVGHETSDANGNKEHLLESQRMIVHIAVKIQNGARSFLTQEYKVLAFFIVIFSVLVWIFVDFIDSKSIRFYTVISYIVGAVTSMICGALGMTIAVASNYRTAFKAQVDMNSAFNVAYRGGTVMGFLSVAIALSVLLTLMLVYIHIFDPIYGIEKERGIVVLMEYVAGYGLGGSTVALFGRVGGGIYTKAADVGADLVGKIEAGLEEDSPNNPATIADNVGDNVGDIAGMGSDLFGSFAESTCAALILISMSPSLSLELSYVLYPLMISAIGILACLLTSIYGVFVTRLEKEKDIELHLRQQLILSTIFIILGLLCISYFGLPATFDFYERTGAAWYYPFVCVSCGLVSGLLIGFSTEYFTSKDNSPVQEMARSCSSGPAINVIYGLALGYMSCLIPIGLLGITILVSLKLLGLLGAALAAIGMLSNLSIGLAIDAFGPISDNAGGIAEMSGLDPEVRKKTDALDAAGNTTAAIGKGFAIGSAALVSLALYGAFILRIKESAQNKVKNVEIIDPWIFCSLLYGALIPYIFSAMTMKSVGSAAQEMVKEVREQFKNENIKNGTQEPDYERCIMVSTVASLKEMVAPAVLVIVTPLFFGIVFHPLLVAGILPGALLSGVHLAISMSNSGGAWDNCKKLIESGTFAGADGKLLAKKSDEHKAAVVGDPLRKI